MIDVVQSSTPLPGDGLARPKQELRDLSFVIHSSDSITDSPVDVVTNKALPQSVSSNSFGGNCLGYVRTATKCMNGHFNV